MYTVALYLTGALIRVQTRSFFTFTTRADGRLLR